MKNKLPEPHLPLARTLRTALGSNAVFSSASGLLMITVPSRVAAWLGLETAPPWLLPLLGVGLIGFAADLTHQATRSRMASWRALYASMGDFLWVVASIILLIFWHTIFSITGMGLIIGVALVVGGLGCWQVAGILKLHRGQGAGMYRHCILVSVNQSADTVWQRIARIDAISNYMPTLKSSVIREGAEPGPGCIRECLDTKGKRWAEKCTALDTHSRSLNVDFLCGEPEFPFPVSEMKGGWQVLATSSASCEVMVWWELAPKPRWLAPAILPLLAFQADRDFPIVIGNMASDGIPHQTVKGIVRLIPRLC